MRLHVHKKGLRAFGIAESFQKGKSKKAILAGVVMRGDFQIDGFALTKITVGGLDATGGVLSLFEDLKRRDINLLLLNGCVISWYNIVELNKVFKKIQLPLICVTYEESEGLEKFFKDNFKDWRKRVAKYRKLGSRMPIKLHTKKKVFVRFLGIENEKEVKRVLDKFTLQGAVPEPLRVARLLARAMMRSSQ
ncbi:MAG: DUF99 family protein [Methanobacteriota archaeon]